MKTTGARFSVLPASTVTDCICTGDRGCPLMGMSCPIHSSLTGCVRRSWLVMVSRPATICEVLTQYSALMSTPLNGAKVSDRKLG